MWGLGVRGLGLRPKGLGVWGLRCILFTEVQHSGRFAEGFHSPTLSPNMFQQRPQVPSVSSVDKRKWVQLFKRYRAQMN